MSSNIITDMHIAMAISPIAKQVAESAHTAYNLTENVNISGQDYILDIARSGNYVRAAITNQVDTHVDVTHLWVQAVLANTPKTPVEPKAVKKSTKKVLDK